LALFHYILAGMLAPFGCFPLINVGIGLLLYFEVQNDPRPESPPPAVGLLITAFGAVASLVSWAMAAAAAMCGDPLHVPRRYMVCMVVACLETLNMPFGTALGVFTIVTLSDKQGKAMFDRMSSTSMPDANPIEIVEP